MKEDDSYKKGEVSSKDGHHKRSNNSSVAVRGTSETEFDYGLALYCVDCGTEGDFVISGTLSAGISGVTECSMRLHGTMQFGLNLGLNAYVKYSNDWKSKQKALDIYKIGVPGIATFSPYIGIQLSAGFGFEASGQILLGATAIWDDIDMQIDLASSSNSHANGLVPRFEKRAEAKGELEVTAYVGLPIELGVRMQVGGFLEFIDLDWEAAVSEMLCERSLSLHAVVLIIPGRPAFVTPQRSISRVASRYLLNCCRMVPLSMTSTEVATDLPGMCSSRTISIYSYARTASGSTRFRS